jgi:ribonuclease HII
LKSMASIPYPRVLRSVTKATAKQRMLKQLICSDAPEQALRYYGFRRIAGVDEVGRGALFGPVVAAAVILPECLDELAKAGLKDSKQLTREERETLDVQIREMALALCVMEIDAETIDRVNIYQATRMAMLAAVQGLTLAPDHLLIDAMRLDHPCRQTKLIYGDALSLSIAAASVVAKVHRDALMREHRQALVALGPSVLHRRTFAPVRAVDPDALMEEQLSPELLFDDTELLDGELEEDC